MSVDLKRLQQLAEAVGWKISEIEPIKKGYVLQLFRMQTTDGVCNYPSLTPIRKRLEQEYRKLAEQEMASFKIEMKLRQPSFDTHDGTNRYQYYTRIADELAVKEPTINMDCEKHKVLHAVAIALWGECPVCRLYEREEK